MAYAPTNCDLIVTENCFMRCRMCHIWKHKRDDSLISDQVYFDFMDDLKRSAGERMQIQFVGGEPLVKQGITGLIKKASSLGFSTTMTTNGYLIDRKIAAEIAASGLKTIGFSLESLDEKKHDFLRGTPGTYARIMEAIKYFGKEKAPGQIFISTILCGENLDDVVKIAEWVNAAPEISFVYFQAIMQPFATPEDGAWHEKEEFKTLWPEHSAVNRALDSLSAMQARGYKIANPAGQFEAFKRYFHDPEKFIKKIKCNLGHNAFTVLPDGNVYLCFSLPPIGNILNEKIGDIWNSSEAESTRKQIAACRKNCKLMINCFFEEE